MPYDGSGNYSLPSGSTAVTGATILASVHNTPIEDIASALSQVLLRSGVAPMSGSLNANGNKVTGLAAGTTAGDAVRYEQAFLLAAAATQTITLAAAGTVLALESTNADAGVGPSLDLYRNSASPENNDVIGAINWFSKDAAGNKTQMAMMGVQVTDVADGSEDATLFWQAITGGALATKLLLNGAALFPAENGVVDLGGGALRFNTTHTNTIELGNASDTTLSRGAAGRLDVEGGAGSLYVASIEVGNASDTTIERLSAGNISIQGNRVYRAGGTDVPISDGGTGASSAVGAASAILADGFSAAMSDAAIFQRDGGGTAANTVLRVQRTDAPSGPVGGELIDFWATSVGTPAQIGSITGNGAGGTDYNTTSDGRMKPEEHRRPISDSGEIIDALNPVYFKWKDGRSDFGYIAQEAYAVSPLFASPGQGEPGGKDFRPWMMQRGRMDAIHTAELKSIRTRLAALEARA